MRSSAPAALLAVCLSATIAAFAAPLPTYAENPALTVVVEHDATGGEAEYGSAVHFSYTVSNSGDETITAVSVDDDWAGHVGDVASLAPGEAERFERTIVVEGSVGGAGTCRAAGQSWAGTTVTAFDDYFIDVFFADDFTDFALEKRLVSGEPVAGGRLVYRLTIRNVSGDDPDPDAASLQVVDDYDESLARVSDAGGGTVSAGTLAWQVDAPGAGESPVVIEYELRLDADASGRFANRATLSNPLDPVAENDADSVVVLVRAAATPSGEGGSGSAPGGGAGGGAGADGAAGDGSSGTDASATASGGDPFLPFTGAPLVPTLPLAAALGLLGMALRRRAA